jgi:hypothetical protein
MGKVILKGNENQYSLSIWREFDIFDGLFEIEVMKNYSASKIYK